MLWQLSYQCAFFKKIIKNGEFLCSHFNNEDGKIHNIFDILCFIISRKVKRQLKHKIKDVCSVWRGCCDWQNVSTVVCEVPCGDFSLDDAPRSGGPVEADSETETLIDNNQHFITWEIADIFKIFRSIKVLVKMKNVSLILQKKLNGLFGHPNIRYSMSQQTCQF